ncbi:transposase [Streptomyces sp. NPDC057798]|uniref:transposase n=1 Tax=Streptomyces sp. NPDC057798 TaxID=3346252 RepID=UPI00367CECCD
MLNTETLDPEDLRTDTFVVVKNYPPEFKADAVALYKSRPEATIRSVAADPGINPETLRNWVRRPE